MTKKEFNLMDLIKKAAQAAKEELEPSTKKVKIGRVSLPMIERVREISERHEKQHETMNQEIEAYGEQLAEEAAAKFKAFVNEKEAAHKPDCLQAKRDMAAAWDEIHQQLGLSEEESAENMQLNAVTGDITKEVPIEQEETNIVH